MQLTPQTPVFITGGSGFVGRTLIAALVARGCPVRALARSPQAEATVAALGATPVPGELADTEAMQAGMADCEVAIHAAAMVDLWGPRREFYHTTVNGTRNALAAAEAAGITRFVHISTEAVLAGGYPIVRATESAPYPRKPNGPYPWSKGLAERYVIGANGPAMATIVVRPRFVWGRGDTNLLPALTAALKSKSWLWFGGGHHLTSTCHVQNLAEGTLLAAEHGQGGEIYFLTDGDPVEFRDFLSRMAATQHVKIPTRAAPLWLAYAAAAAAETYWTHMGRAGSPPLTRTAVNLMFTEVTVVDRKAREELGYRSTVSIEQGLAELQA